mgnify:FL=1
MLSVVIQAGGGSRRMGQDKALMTFMGEPLIRRVLDRLRLLADEILVTTNSPDDYRFLGIPLFADRVPGRGALGGLHTALDAASHPLVAVVACDMPFVNTTLLTAERAILQTTASDAVIPDTGRGLEPFHAVYRKAACLPAVRTALDQNHWRVDAWFSQVKLYILSPEMTRQYDPDLHSFFNLNTPQDVEQAERIAASLGE